MNTDKFFEKKQCERCGEPLDVRTISWFSKVVICMGCADKEKKAKEHLSQLGLDPAEYEGVGRIPEMLTPIIFGRE